MTAYLLVITPEGDGRQGYGQAAIRVETSPVPRITEVTITAAAAEGLSAATLPAIDLDGVIRALTAGARPSWAETPPAPVPEAPAGRGKSGRPYRQMPDAAELRAVYAEIGTVTGVAVHYQVPRHTAQGWMSRLRRLRDGAQS